MNPKMIDFLFENFKKLKYGREYEKVKKCSEMFVKN